MNVTDRQPGGLVAYFERIDASTFMPTEHAGGAWNTDELHVAPVFGLMTHVLEGDRADRGRTRGTVGRLSFDILGVIASAPLEVAVEVLRPGRTVELVEVVLSQGGRAAVRLRAWQLAHADTAGVAGGPVAALPGPDELPTWDPTTRWPGGFIDSIEVRRDLHGPGDGTYWVRTPLPLLAGEEQTPLTSAATLFDVANGMAVREDPTRVGFPNVDLTAHLLREPARGWLGYRTSVSFGDGGTGLTSTTLHDERGHLGALAQVLALRHL